MNRIKIALIEEQRLIRDGIAALLKEVEELEVLTVAENCKAFIAQLIGMHSFPDVLLIAIHTAGQDVLDLMSAMQKNYPATKVVILATHDQERFIIKMMEAGMAGFLLKNCDIEELIKALRTVHNVGVYFNENVMMAIRNGYKLKQKQICSVSHIPIDLTEREIEVLKLICMEFTNIEIARKLYISPRTVDGHRNNLLAKTGCKNTAGLVLFAVNNNILESMLSVS